MNFRPQDSGFFLGLTAFVVGAAVMTIEMTSSRILAPHFGTSLFVWTALIVTVLLSMAIGYWVGGRLTRHGRDWLGPLLSAAAVTLMVGFRLSSSASEALSASLFHLDVAVAVLFLGALLLSFFVFSVPVFLLAAAGPSLLSLWASRSGDVGTTSGRYFALSSAGSVIGTVAPSLWLVPELGVRVTMMVTALVIGLLGLSFASGRLRWLFALLVPASLLLVWWQVPSVPGNLLTSRETPYQLVRVEEFDGRRFMIFNEGSGVQSIWQPKEGPTGMYYDQLAAVPFLRGGDGRNQSLAVLGLAGGTAIRQYVSSLPEGAEPDVTGVEIDPVVVEVAREWFGLDELPVEVVQADGRLFLENDRNYDLIFSDAYSTQLYIPPHMASREFFSLVRSRLNEGGLFVMNINAADRNSRLLQALTNTLAAVFPEVHVSKAGRTWNWLVVAGDLSPDYANAMARLSEGYASVAEELARAERVEFDPDGEVLTDDRAPIELMTEKMIFSQALLGSG